MINTQTLEFGNLVQNSRYYGLKKILSSFSSGAKSYFRETFFGWKDVFQSENISESSLEEITSKNEVSQYKDTLAMVITIRIESKHSNSNYFSKKSYEEITGMVNHYVSQFTEFQAKYELDQLKKTTGDTIITNNPNIDSRYSDLIKKDVIESQIFYIENNPNNIDFKKLSDEKLEQHTIGNLALTSN